MDNILYNNISNGNYYLITMKGDFYSFVINISSPSSNTSIISNDDIKNYKEIYLNENTLYNVINDLNIVNINNINFKNFKNYNYIYYNFKIIIINNWMDLYNFILTII